MKKKEGKEKVAIMGEADWGKDGRLRARIKLISFAHEGGVSQGVTRILTTCAGLKIQTRLEVGLTAE
jgi:hypothetical protein